MSKLIPVAEIFGPTIQGEGPNVGIKTLFVRVTGCDFKCEWCDSKFAWKPSENSKTYTSDELIETLIEKCTETHTSNVVLTGGNPCLYDFEPVIDVLHTRGISVDVETQGSILPKWLKYADTIVISPKAPSSKQPDVFDNVKQWLCENEFSCLSVAIKIPVFNDEDFEFAKKYSTLTDLTTKLYLSVGNTDTQDFRLATVQDRVLNDYEKLINKVMNSDLDYVYVLPQVHTLVWGNKQGV